MFQMDITRAFRRWSGKVRYRYPDQKIHASIAANAFCGLHNDEYTKFQPCENCGTYRA